MQVFFNLKMDNVLRGTYDEANGLDGFILNGAKKEKKKEKKKVFVEKDCI